MIKVIEQIVVVLEDVGEENWKKGFLNMLDSYRQTKDLNSLKAKIRRIYAGMGSFSDLVLHKDGKVCIKENNTLDKLRYKLIKKAI